MRSSLIAEERKLSLEKRRRKKSNKGLKRSNSVNEFDVNEYRVTEHDNTQHSLNSEKNFILLSIYQVLVFSQKMALRHSVYAK